MTIDTVASVARNAVGGAGLGFGGGFVLQRLLVNVAGGALVAHLPPGNAQDLHLLAPFLLGGMATGFLTGAAVTVWLRQPVPDGAGDDDE